MSTPAAAVDESPMWISSREGDLFGVLTRPEEGTDNGTVLVFLSTGGGIPSCGRNQFPVRFARRMAACGYHAFRFDYHGLGESGGRLVEFRLDDPCVGDAEAVMDRLRAEGYRRFVLLGQCFGARTALAIGPRQEGIIGMALTATPLRDMHLPAEWIAHKGERGTLRRYGRLVLRPGIVRDLLDADRRQRYLSTLRAKSRKLVALAHRHLAPGRTARHGGISPAVVRQFRRVVDRGIPVLFLYGEEDLFLTDWVGAVKGPFGEALGRAGDAIRVELVPEKAHALGRIHVQEAVAARTEAWLQGLEAGVQ